MASRPNIWNYDDPPLTPLVSKLGTLANGLYSRHIKDAKFGIDRFFSLYLFILQRLNMSPEELRLLILSKGMPVFSADTMKSIMTTIDSQKSLPFAKRLLVNAQVGGQSKDLSMGSMTSAGLRSLAGVATKGIPKPPVIAAPEMLGKATSLASTTGISEASKLVGNTAAAAAMPSVLGAHTNAPANTNPSTNIPDATPGDTDDNPSTKKFWDIFIKRRIGDTITRFVPTKKDKATPLIFALYGLEQLENIGPLISTFLDTVTLQLPTVGELLGIGAGTLIQLLPIPYAGIIADGAAYAISLLFIMISSITSFSRKQFGTSFTVGLGAIPLIGDTLSDAALLFEKQYERYIFNKKRLMKSVDNMSPHMAEFLDYWAPEAMPKSGPPVTLDSEDVLMDLMDKSVGEHGVERTRAMLSPSNIGGLPAEARTMLATGNKKGGRRHKTRRIKRS